MADTDVTRFRPGGFWTTDRRACGLLDADRERRELSRCIRSEKEPAPPIAGGSHAESFGGEYCLLPQGSFVFFLPRHQDFSRVTVRGQQSCPCLVRKAGDRLWNLFASQDLSSSARPVGGNAQYEPLSVSSNCRLHHRHHDSHTLNQPLTIVSLKNRCRSTARRSTFRKDADHFPSAVVDNNVVPKHST